ncbi:hypothetical protein Tco_0212823 [Tanacetum coccineum]
MSTDKESSAAGTDNRPPMLVESDYESWKIRIERYIRGKPLGKLIWRSIQNGPTSASPNLYDKESVPSFVELIPTLKSLEPHALKTLRKQEQCMTGKLLLETIREELLGNVGNRVIRGTQNYGQMMDNIGKKVICYNYHGEGHVSRQSTGYYGIPTCSKGYTMRTLYNDSDVEDGHHASTAAFMAIIVFTSGTNGATTFKSEGTHRTNFKSLIIYNLTAKFKMFQLRHLKVNQEQSLVNDSLRAELARYKQEMKDLSWRTVYWLPAVRNLLLEKYPTKTCDTSYLELICDLFFILPFAELWSDMLIFVVILKAFVIFLLLDFMTLTFEEDIDSEESSAAGTDNRPPMLVESDYESWRIRIERYIRGKPLVQVTRDKRDEEFTEIENNKELADIQATNILSQGLPRHVFNILNQTRTGKEIWDNVELLMKGEMWDTVSSNQLRTSSNSRSHATVHDGQIISETIQRRAPGNVGSTGHVSRRCKEKKRVKDSQYFKDKMLLMEAKEKGTVLDAEAEAFLADVEYTAPYDQPLTITTTNMFEVSHEDAYDSEVDEGPHAAAAFMANLSSISGTNGATTS